MRCAFIAAVAGLALASAAAPALAANACTQDFYAGEEPSSPHPSAVLCFSEYAVVVDGLLRDPVWSAEHLTAHQVQGAVGNRENRFHAESRIPETQRAELADYAGEKGFDRGHMSPVGDMDTPAAKFESFSLANMVPQSSVLNEGLWAGIEAQVRGLATRDGEVWVVTGPAFAAQTPLQAQPVQLPPLKGRVAVPSMTWKAVYDPKLGAAAYVALNDGSGKWVFTSITVLEGLIGFDPFPALPDAVKAKAADLPPPDPKSIHKPH